MDVEPERPRQGQRAFEQAGRGSYVLSVERPLSGSCEAIPGAERERGIGLPELGEVERRLLEVVADDLVALDEFPTVLVEPVGEALMQVGADCLRERVVGGVADQQVTEAEAVVAGELGAVGSDQLPANERGEPGRDLGLLGRERLHGPAVEDLALDGSPLEHLALGVVELVEARRQQRLQRGGTSTSACSAAIASISEMNSGLPPAACAIRSRSSPATPSPMSASA